MIFLCILICLLSTMVGAVSGIGGGVIIKPMLDLTLPALGMTKVSFLSACAVCSMALFSVIRNRFQATPQPIEMKIAVPLGAGSVLGGTLGKALFQNVSAALNADTAVKLVQNAVLLALMLIVTVGAFKKKEEAAPKARAPWKGFALGLLCGGLSAFLGIGGGPFNMLILTGFFGMTHKKGALYSLFVIVFSQAAGIVTACISGSALPGATWILGVCLAGIGGGVIGRALAKKMQNRAVKMLYGAALIFIILLCAFNIVHSLIH